METREQKLNTLMIFNFIPFAGTPLQNMIKEDWIQEIKWWVKNERQDIYGN